MNFHIAYASLERWAAQTHFQYILGFIVSHSSNSSPIDAHKKKSYSMVNAMNMDTQIKTIIAGSVHVRLIVATIKAKWFLIDPDKNTLRHLFHTCLSQMEHLKPPEVFSLYALGSPFTFHICSGNNSSLSPSLSKKYIKIYWILTIAHTNIM